MKCTKCQTEHNSAFCPNCGTAANSGKKSKSNKVVLIALAIVVALGLIGFIGSEISSNKKIDLEQTNVVEGVVEYKINHVFTTDIIEGLLRKEGAFCYEADSDEKFLVIDTEVKNLKTSENTADELIEMTLTINGTEYSASGYIITEESADNDKKIASEETARVYYAAIIDSGEDPGNMTLKSVCGEETASCEISLSMFENKKDSLTLYNSYSDNSTKSIRVEKVWLTDDAKPTDYEKYDYYDHYIADEGKTILAVKMSVDNYGNEPLYINEIAGVACYYEQGSSSGGRFYLEGENGSRLTFEECNYLLRDKPSIDPYGTGTVYYLIQLPETVENGPLELELYLAGETYYYTVS